MNFQQGSKKWAIQQMLEGKKVCRSSWTEPSEHIWMSEDGTIHDEKGEPFEVNYYGDGWELYEEPRTSERGEDKPLEVEFESVVSTMGLYAWGVASAELTPLKNKRVKVKVTEIPEGEK